MGLNKEWKKEKALEGERLKCSMLYKFSVQKLERDLLLEPKPMRI